MNSLLDDDDDIASSGESRELTLSTATILAIFAGLVLLCGAFFGFGYKMGSHKPVSPLQASTPESAVAPSATFSTFKPAAGSPATGAPASAPPSSPRPVPSPRQQDDPQPPPAHTAAPVTRAPAEPETTSPAVVAGSFVVQVAAFTHQEDADLLVHALKAKSYPAFARSEPQDKLFHIQVGPFTNRKDAEAAKQRLLADGYQPILK